MARRHRILSVVVELFKELIPWPQPRELDFNVDSRTQTAQLDQLPRQLDDFHRFAHIENEYFSTLALGRTLKHQSHGFWDRHEVAGNIRMGDRHRPAGSNLLLEDRYHAARGTQDVAEPHRHQFQLR